MQKKDCFLVGTVFKLHGYKGDVKIYNELDIPFDFSNITYFLLEKNNSLIPYFITNLSVPKQSVLLVKLEDVDSEKAAQQLLKLKVYLPKELLPVGLKDSFLEDQIEGFVVVDKILGELGTVSFVSKQTAQRLIYVQNDEQEFCIPFHSHFIQKIDKEKKQIIVSVPEELVKLN